MENPDDEDERDIATEERAMFSFFALFIVVWFLLFAVVHCVHHHG